MLISRSAMAAIIPIVVSMLSVVAAGDACCKAEAARRALVVDPFAAKPSNWDDEDDGPWEAPKIALVDLPAWYRLLHETRLGVMGAAPLLISGVIAAALLTTIVKPLFPPSVLRSLLGRNAKDKFIGGSAVVGSIRGSIFGLLVPFCSCGALPLAMALKQEGLSSSSIAAFVTAAQAGGIDSLFFTYAIFGARVAILRLVAAGVLAFLVGMTLANDNDNIEKDRSKFSEELERSDKKLCCSNNSSRSDSCEDEKPQAMKPFIPLLAALVNNSVEIFSSVAVWVFLGVVVSALASIWAPPTLTKASVHISSSTLTSTELDIVSVVQTIVSRATLFLLSLPMTICEHGVVSMAESLLGVGFSAGTAVALIVTGPSTNVGTLLMLSRLNSHSLRSSNFAFDALKIVSVILVFGITLSFLADDFGSAVMIKKTETTETSGSGLSLPEWLNQNAISLAGLFTVASILQSPSLLSRSTSIQSSSSSRST